MVRHRRKQRALTTRRMEKECAVRFRLRGAACEQRVVARLLAQLRQAPGDEMDERMEPPQRGEPRLKVRHHDVAAAEMHELVGVDQAPVG